MWPISLDCYCNISRQVDPSHLENLSALKLMSIEYCDNQRTGTLKLIYY